MKWKSVAMSLLAAQAVTGFRFPMYMDQWHKDLPDSDKTGGITHAIMSFAEAKSFNSDPPTKWQPFEPIDTTRKRFSKDTKLLVAIGGWGDTSGFSTGAKDEASRKRYAKNVAAMVQEFGLDGVDIDWEYPGGNGDDYKKVPNSEKTWEIEAYPLFLAAIREAIGNDKVLSIAVPGKKGDMIAFTKEQGPNIWRSVDFVNVMTYDLMNRRNTETKHHTGLKDSLDTIRAYKEIGLDSSKINLGFAYYAKYFETAPDAGCDQHPLGCQTAVMEDAQGADTGKSGVVTFDKAQDGVSATAKASWARALQSGITDEDAGGQYYFDKDVNYFWTWDTPALIKRKFKDIVDAEKLGGVFAWSLAQDNLNWEHLQAMQEGAKERS
ncbi:glycoside hydrolase superfamily [Aspergillus leporis]|uniref:chitinase n=1 Tax=Aspergillus leporis TaxID=41062 RepID=A0A5N5WUC4_9EURO|nr:glycoside hydrolase superfamily [Aspergillus leporis]